MSAKKIISAMFVGTTLIAAASPVLADRTDGRAMYPRRHQEEVVVQRQFVQERRTVAVRERPDYRAQPAYHGRQAYRGQPVYQGYSGYRGQPVYAEPAYYPYGAGAVYSDRRDNTAIGVIGGAILGAIIGNQVGRGDGGSTVIGAGAGAVLGGIIGGGM